MAPRKVEDLPIETAVIMYIGFLFLVREHRGIRRASQKKRMKDDRIIKRALAMLHRILLGPVAVAGKDYKPGYITKRGALLMAWYEDRTNDSDYNEKYLKSIRDASDKAALDQDESSSN